MYSKYFKEILENQESLDTTEAFMLKYGTFFDPNIKYLDWYRRIDETTSRFKLFLVHPGAGKSTRLKWEVVRRIANNRNYKVAYISKSSKKAALFMEAMGKELRKNQYLIRDFGEFYEHGNTWNTETIKVRGSGSDPTPSISNYGATTQIEGMRPDMIILDDVIDINTILSPAECLGMEERFLPWVQRLNLMGRSEFWVIGHRFSPDDLYEYIEQMGSFEVRILPAYNERTRELLAHELWDWPQFEEMIINTHRDYEIRAHYQQEKVPLGDCELDWSWIANNVLEEMPEGKKVAFFDPAYGADKKSDWSGGMVGVKYGSGVCITAIKRWKISSGWKRTFSEWARSQGATEINVEINNAQTLADEMKEYMRESGFHITVKGFKSVKNKEFRIGNLEVPAKRGEIWIMDYLIGTDGYNELKTQWSAFPNLRHDDVLDVLEMIVTRFRGSGNRAVFSRLM